MSFATCLCYAMNKSLNLQSVVLLKKIIDSVRCGLCDTFDGDRLRYLCGHTLCTDCAEKSDDCLFCEAFTSTKNIPISDVPLTRRVQHASKLLRAFEETFNIDVFKIHSMTEHLRREREIFPKCIQAELKYVNKRKSIFTLEKKSQSILLPGEGTSVKMDKSLENVHQWLERNERDLETKLNKKPLSDLNVNTIGNRFNKSPIKRRADRILEKVQENIVKKRKNNRDIFPNKKKVKDHNVLDVFRKRNLNSKVLKNRESCGNVKGIGDLVVKHESINHNSPIKENNEKDGNGSEVDDQLVIIDDSQSHVTESSFSMIDNANQTNDKDKLAWLAVLEAHKYTSEREQTLNDSEVNETTHNFKEPQNDFNKKCEVEAAKLPYHYNIPFLKKSLLFNTCVYCSYAINKDYEERRKRDISITIQNASFTTTVNFSRCLECNPRFLSKRSKFVQTESKNYDQGSCVNDTNSSSLQNNCEPTSHKIEASFRNVRKNMESEDMFSNEFKGDIDQQKKQLKKTDLSLYKSNLVISESDSEIEDGAIVEVQADVHRSSDQIDYGVLKEIFENKSTKRRERGMTPISTDSSDKENRNPNRPKNNKLKNAKRKKYK